MMTDTAYSTFFKGILGTNYQLLTAFSLFGKIISYIDDLFEDFDSLNPIENPSDFDFPFKNINLNHLFLVHEMDERMELLKIAEEKKMTYYEFLDFVVNYLNCVNDEEGKEIYLFIRSSIHRGLYYVKKK